MRALEFITGHVIYNLAYTYKFQLKTTYDRQFPFHDNKYIPNLQIQHRYGTVPMNCLSACKHSTLYSQFL